MGSGYNCYPAQSIPTDQSPVCDDSIGRVGQLEGALACRLHNAALRLVPDRANASALRKMASQPI